MTWRPDVAHWTTRIGGRIRSRRKDLGLTLEDLSVLSGSAVPALSNIERGKCDVKLSTLIALAAALRIELPIRFASEEDSTTSAEPFGTSEGYDLDDD